MVTLFRRGPSSEMKTFPACLLCLNRKMTITLGACNLTQKEPTWQKLKVIKQIVHPNYNPYTGLNDIILLKMPLSFLCFSVALSLNFLLTQVFLILSFNTFPCIPLSHSMSSPPHWEKLLILLQNTSTSPHYLIPPRFLGQ